MLELTFSPKDGLRSHGRGRDSPLHILCLGAHSDDIEIGAGGTVLTLLHQLPGSHVTWVVCAADGVRESEALASATELLADAGSLDTRLLGLRESYFNVGPDAKDAFEELKASLGRGPDVIVTHCLHDRHQDHETVARLTWNTWRDNVLLEYEIPKYEGDLRTPNVYVPLPEQIVDRKLDHLAHHFHSQHDKNWYDGDTFRGLMRIRGVECQSPTKFAEAFHGRKLVLGLGASY